MTTISVQSRHIDRFGSFRDNSHTGSSCWQKRDLHDLHKDASARNSLFVPATCSDLEEDERAKERKKEQKGRMAADFNKSSHIQMFYHSRGVFEHDDGSPMECLKSVSYNQARPPPHFKRNPRNFVAYRRHRGVVCCAGVGRFETYPARSSLLLYLPCSNKAPLHPSPLDLPPSSRERGRCARSDRAK